MDERGLVIGLTGPVGSGVTTASHALADHGFDRVSLSDSIKDEFRKREGREDELAFDITGVEDFRRKLQDIGNEKRKEDPAFWVKKALAGQDQEKSIVVDSIRNIEEAEELRRMFAPRFYLVALHASQETRWDRVKEDYGGNQRDFERDDLRDSDEDVPEGQQVSKCVQIADYVFVNEDNAGSESTRKNAIHGKLEVDLDLMRNAYVQSSAKRDANKEEVHMATAYSQSHMSRCMKRHVGAVVVDSSTNLPLSLGYNENPVGMLPCINEWGYCFKDEDMNTKLEKRRNVYCPDCGEKHPSLANPWECSGCGRNLKTYFFPSRNIELCTAIHAEERAIRSLGDRSANGATIYTTTFPCFQCSRYIVDAGIEKVVYVEAYPIKEAHAFLLRNKVTIESFRGFKARAFNLIFKQVH